MTGLTFRQEMLQAVAADWDATQAQVAAQLPSAGRSHWEELPAEQQQQVVFTLIEMRIQGYEEGVRAAQQLLRMGAAGMKSRHDAELTGIMANCLSRLIEGEGHE